jgi:hypothetical protein
VNYDNIADPHPFAYQYFQIQDSFGRQGEGQRS